MFVSNYKTNYKNTQKPIFQSRYFVSRQFSSVIRFSQMDLVWNLYLPRTCFLDSIQVKFVLFLSHDPTWRRFAPCIGSIFRISQSATFPILRRHFPILVPNSANWNKNCFPVIFVFAVSLNNIHELIGARFKRWQGPSLRSYFYDTLVDHLVNNIYSKFSFCYNIAINGRMK